MQALSADGVVHDFPDGTDMSVIDRVMKSYAGAAAATKEPEPQPDPNAAMSEFPTYAAPASAEPAPGNAVMERIGKAASGAFMGTPTILTQRAQDAVDSGGPIGRYITNPAIHVADVAHGAVNAGMAALAQTAMEVFGEKGGRDFMAFASSFPMVPEIGQLGAMRANSPKALAAVPRPAEAPQFLSEQSSPFAELDTRNKISKLLGEDNYAAQGAPNQGAEAIAAIGKATDIDGVIAAAGKAAAEEPAPAGQPQSMADYYKANRASTNRDIAIEPSAETPVRPMAEWTQPISKATPDTPDTPVAPAPAEQAPVGPVANTNTPAPELRSVGSAASREGTMDTTFGRSAREMKGAAADMELADLMKTPAAGDARDIIPGATQTRAEIELSPSVSREAKGLRQEFREGFNEHEKANNELYHQWVDDIAPPREQTATMKDIREENWKAAEKTVFGPNSEGAPVSTAPVVQHLMDVLSDPIERHNSYAQKHLQPFLDKLTDENGAPIEIGAKELYGIRREMGRKVKDMATDTDLAHLRDQFGDLIKVTDEAITTGAPDYRTMMDAYREASIPINAAERLQDIKTKITNGSDRIITFGALDRYMKSLWMERHGPNPYAPAKDIPQGTWDHLMQLHERLARSASADELARVKGSDTTQLMMEMMRKGAIGIAHAGAAHFTGGLGNIAIPYITKQIDQGRALKKVGQHLNPDLSQYPPVVP